MALLLQPYAFQLSALSERVSPALLVRAAVALAYVVLKWDEAMRTRKTLRSLSDDQLRDVGLTRDEALREADRNFWR